MTAEFDSALNEIQVAQSVSKTWSVKFPKDETKKDSIFGRRAEASITTRHRPDEEATSASFHAGFMGSDFTAIQLRVIADLCLVVADAMDAGTA